MIDGELSAIGSGWPACYGRTCFGFVQSMSKSFFLAQQIPIKVHSQHLFIVCEVELSAPVFVNWRLDDKTLFIDKEKEFD